MRNFLRDLSNQIVLGTFVSTFVYCLLVLRTVRGTDDAQFVPHLAVTVGVLLAIVSLGVLIFFIHHISTSIQASHVISNVAVDLERAVDHLFPEAVGSATGRVTDGGNKSSLPADFADLAREVSANANGYIQAIDSEQLMGLATEHDLVLRVEARPGTFVRTGRVLLAARSDTPLNPSLEGRLRDAFIVGDERTPTQDIEFSINQLVELAVRALSPGINDPATACVCLDRLEQVLCRLAGRTMPSSNRYDTAGVLRVVVCPVTFPAIANVAFDEIERHGRTSVSVTLRLIDAIGAIASCVQREQDRLALLRHVTSIGSHLHDTFTDEADRAKLEQRYRTAVSALQRPNRALWPAKVDERDIA